MLHDRSNPRRKLGSGILNDEKQVAPPERAPSWVEPPLNASGRRRKTPLGSCCLETT